jgi:DNA-binding PadR family transcriptional regulator
MRDIKMSELTRFEEQILLSIWKLKDGAYGPAIYNYIRDLTQKEMAIGGIYFPLERLEKKKLLESYLGKPTSVRGGQRKRYYRLTKRGLEELLKMLDIQQSFWKDLPDLEYLENESK